VYTSLDYAQTGLIAAVFFFKVSMVFPSTMLCPLVSNKNLKKIISIVEFLNTFNQRKKKIIMICCAVNVIIFSYSRRNFLVVSGALVSSIPYSSVFFLRSFYYPVKPRYSLVELGALFSSGGAYGRAPLELGVWSVGGSQLC
jgi:hypothetical protein